VNANAPVASVADVASVVHTRSGPAAEGRPRRPRTRDGRCPRRRRAPSRHRCGARPRHGSSRFGPYRSEPVEASYASSDDDRELPPARERAFERKPAGPGEPRLDAHGCPFPRDGPGEGRRAPKVIGFDTGRAGTRRWRRASTESQVDAKPSPLTGRLLAGLAQNRDARHPASLGRPARRRDASDDLRRRASAVSVRAPPSRGTARAFVGIVDGRQVGTGRPWAVDGAPVRHRARAVERVYDPSVVQEHGVAGRRHGADADGVSVATPRRPGSACRVEVEVGFRLQVRERV